MNINDYLAELNTIFLSRTWAIPLQLPDAQGFLGAGWHCYPLAKGQSILGLCLTLVWHCWGKFTSRVGSSLRSHFAGFSQSLCAWLPLLNKARGVQLHTGLWEEFYLPGCEQMSLSPSLPRWVLPLVEPSPAAPSPCLEQPGYVFFLLLTDPLRCLCQTVAVWQMHSRVYLLLSVFFSFVVFS